MIRRLFTILSVLSVLLCIGLAVLWVRSYWTDDHVGLSRAKARYTVRSQRGSLSLYGPPPEFAGEQKAWELEADLSDASLSWAVIEEPQGRQLRAAVSKPSIESQLQEIMWPQPLAVRPLLKALDDPRKFVVAHVIFTKCIAQGDRGSWVAGAKDRATYNGLRIDFPPGKTSPWDLKGDIHAWKLYVCAPGAWKVSDPNQLWEIRDHWHRVLDVRMASIPHWPLVLACSVLPILWCRRQRRRMRRKRRGLCLTCGYDLRAHNPGARCPECGSPVPASLAREPSNA